YPRGTRRGSSLHPFLFRWPELVLPHFLQRIIASGPRRLEQLLYVSPHPAVGPVSVRPSCIGDWITIGAFFHAKHPTQQRARYVLWGSVLVFAARRAFVAVHLEHP